MKSLLPFLSLFYIGFASAQTSCFDGADKLINGRCFTLVNQQLSRQDAHNWCRYRNPVTSSYLATVSDTTQSNFLASYARTTFNSNEGSFWIGLWRNTTGSRWQWDDGTPFGWSNFINSQYNYVAGTITNGKWTTYNPDNKLNFVCSYDPNGVPTPATGGTTAPPNWTTQSDPTWETPTMTPTGSECTRNTTSTILFAYSNDLDDGIVEDIKGDIIYWNQYYPYGYSTFANIRFDVRTEESIQYHKSLQSFNESVYAHMPNASLAYNDSSIGSDIFNAIEKFLNNNNQATLCGSMVFILAKRYPNSVDISNLISQLRQNHIFVYIHAHEYSSGGSNPHSLYEVSSKTNGFCIFVETNMWASAFWASQLIVSRNQFISRRFVVSGSGRIELPIFRSPNPTGYREHVLTVTTVQDHVIDSSFNKVNYTIASVDGSYVFSGPLASNGWPRRGSGIIAYPDMNGTTDYKWTIDYQYKTDQTQVIEIRMYSRFYHDFIPFSN